MSIKFLRVLPSTWGTSATPSGATSVCTSSSWRTSARRTTSGCVPGDPVAATPPDSGQTSSNEPQSLLNSPQNHLEVVITYPDSDWSFITFRTHPNSAQIMHRPNLLNRSSGYRVQVVGSFTNMLPLVAPPRRQPHLRVASQPPLPPPLEKEEKAAAPPPQREKTRSREKREAVGKEEKEEKEKERGTRERVEKERRAQPPQRKVEKRGAEKVKEKGAERGKERAVERPVRSKQTRSKTEAEPPPKKRKEWKKEVPSSSDSSSEASEDERKTPPPSQHDTSFTLPPFQDR